MGSSKKAKTGWMTLEDMDNDLCEFSEIAVNQDDLDEPPLATIVQYNAQMSAIHNSSIFDTHMPYEDVTYIYSGRGRGGLSKFYKPGVPVNDYDQEIYRKIREVSGVGYSNEIIEKSLRAKLGKPEIADSNFSDVHSQSEDTVSTVDSFENRRTTNSSSPRSMTSTPTCSKSDELSSTETNEPENDKDQRPPPLSVILKRAKKTNIPATSKVEAVMESYERMALEPLKSRTKSKSPPKKPPPVKGSVSRIEAESSSDNSPSSDTSYNPADVNSWWRQSKVEPNSTSSSDEPLSWRKKSAENRIFTKEWRKRSPKKDDFNINSAKDFPAL